MVHEICRDELFLMQESFPATPEDAAIMVDLLDTLTAHKNECAGIAANIIGVSKRIIAFDNETQKPSGSPAHMKRRKASCPFPMPEKFNGKSPSRCCTRTRNFRPGSRPLPAELRRSSSMRLTAAWTS